MSWVLVVKIFHGLLNYTHVVLGIRKPQKNTWLSRSTGITWATIGLLSIPSTRFFSSTNAMPYHPSIPLWLYARCGWLTGMTASGWPLTKESLNFHCRIWGPQAFSRGVHHPMTVNVGYGTTNVGCGTTNADAGVGIGLKEGFNNLIERPLISR